MMEKSTQETNISLKWGNTIAKRGFTQIPNDLLYINNLVDDEFKISPSETIVLIQIISYWWNKDELPFPSMEKLSRKSGISTRQVQRAISSLSKKNYLKIRKTKRNNFISSNSYDLSPTVEILMSIAKVHKVPKRRLPPT